MSKMRFALLLLPALAFAQADDAWSPEEAARVLESTRVITLEPGLAELTEAERLALSYLVDAGRLMHELYLQQKHSESLAARDRLASDEVADAAFRSQLSELYYLFKGPVATTSDNQRLPLLEGIAAEKPGKTLYPASSVREELEAWLEANPEKRSELLDVRSVVRRQTSDNLEADLNRLQEYPEVAAMIPGLREMLVNLSAEASYGGYYTIPYALAYAPTLRRVREALNGAAMNLAPSSPDFAAYLKQRARDLLSSDYEAGDAAWVRGRFDNLNLQLGSYETYDDALFGVKAFYGASLLVRDRAKSEALAEAINDLQAIEDALPYSGTKTVSSDIPVGVYNVVADFGQARGANTATILPNDAGHARKYGRTILIRNNILTHPELFALRKQRFDAVMAESVREHLTIEGGFERTLWHEVGHYLGASTTADGRALDDALADRASLLEELKADLVSLFAAPSLRESGYYDNAELRAHYADGIRRTLQDVRPRPTQAYQNMQLMQFNFFMENGLIELDFESGALTVNYDRYHDIVKDMLQQVLLIQYEGDYDAAEAFIQRWNYWEDILHGRLARQIRDGSSAQRILVRYAILGE